MKQKNIVLGLLIFGILGCPKSKTPEAVKAVKFEDSYVISSDLDKNSGLLTLKIQLKEDFHAYAQGEKIGKPVALEIKNINGYQALDAPIIPAGRLKKLAGSGQGYVLEGEFSIKQRLKIGNGVGKALLHMQICTAELCDRPRTHEISL